MGKLKTIGTGLLFGAKALAPSEAQGQYGVEYRRSGNPFIGAIPGASFKFVFGNESNAFQPFVRAGAQGVFIGDEWLSQVIAERDGRLILEGRTTPPRWSVSVGGGASLRVTDNHKLFGSLDAFTSPGYARGRFELGLSSKVNFLPIDNVNLRTSVFTENMSIRGMWQPYNEEPTRDWEGFSRAGVGIALRHDRRLTNRLRFFAEMGYNHAFDFLQRQDDNRGAHTGEFTATAGLSLRINPRWNRDQLGFGGCPPIQQLRRDSRRETNQVQHGAIQPRNCPAMRVSPRDRNTIFNRPNSL